jgi:hypothetical protein
MTMGGDDDKGSPAQLLRAYPGMDARDSVNYCLCNEPAAKAQRPHALPPTPKKNCAGIWARLRSIAAGSLLMFSCGESPLDIAGSSADSTLVTP